MWRWLIAGTAIAFLTGNAFAQTSGVYVAAEGGLFLPASLSVPQSPTNQTENFSTGKSYGAIYGYDFGNGFKTEIEGLTSREAAEPYGANPASGSISTTRLMMNGLYEVSDGAWRMKPYLGAGFGLVDVHARVFGMTNNDWVAAYQLRGGVTMGFTQKLVGSFEYRWTQGSKPNFSLAGIPTKLEVDRHGFVVGINYKY